MASPDARPEGPIFLDRLREWFTPARRDALPGDDRSRRRGLTITICVLAAVVLWFTLSIRKIYTVQLDFPTQVANLPADVALTVLPPPTVQVQARGEGIALLRLRFNPPLLPIDASGSDEVNLEALVNLPPGVVSESVVPRQFTLQKEARITRKIPIRLQASIEPAEAHLLFSPPTLTPDSVAVSGARSIVETLTDWPTQPFRRTNLQDSLVVSIPLADTLAQLVVKDTTVTTLTAVAYPFTEGSRAMRVQVMGVPTSQRVVSLEPSTILVTYRVPVAQYGEVQAAPDFFATVSYDVIRADTTGRVEPELHLPEGVRLRNVEVRPAKLRYYERLVEQ